MLFLALGFTCILQDSDHVTLKVQLEDERMMLMSNGEDEDDSLKDSMGLHWWTSNFICKYKTIFVFRLVDWEKLGLNLSSECYNQNKCLINQVIDEVTDCNPMVRQKCHLTTISNVNVRLVVVWCIKRVTLNNDNSMDFFMLVQWKLMRNI